MEKQKIDRLPSTIVLGVFLTVGLLLFLILINFNMQQAINDMSESSNEMSNEEKVVAAPILALIGATAIILVGYGSAIILFVISLVCLLLSIKNRKSTNIVTRIFSFVYDGCFGLLLAFSILKFVLFITGIG